MNHTCGSLRPFGHKPVTFATPEEAQQAVSVVCTTYMHMHIYILEVYMYVYMRDGVLLCSMVDVRGCAEK
jgi:hypothetical protein